jgi:magnesium-transporting ATPase (P-type)
MAFLLPALEGIGSGLLGSAIGGSLGSALGGNAENAAMNALNAQDEQFQLGMYSSEIQNQEQLQMQSEAFDQMMDERSENMREVETICARTSPHQVEALLAEIRRIAASSLKTAIK